MIVVFGDKIYGVDYQKRKGVYGVILNHEEGTVMTVHNGNRHHFLPGGGIEENESHIECLERELMEETGYRVSVGSYVGNAMRYFLSRSGDPLLSDGYFYLVELKEKVQEPMEEDHFIKWIDYKDTKQLLFHEHHYWAIKIAEKLMRTK